MNSMGMQVPNPFPGLRPFRSPRPCPRDSELLTLPAQTTQVAIGYGEERYAREADARKGEIGPMPPNE